MNIYLFGKKDEPGLNHVLLEFKKHLFYNWHQDTSPALFCEQVLNIVRKLIIKEKQIFIAENKLPEFSSKWKKFSDIYDFYGPDLQIV